MASVRRTITVRQIHCERCEDTIRTALGKLDGVRAVRPIAATNTVQIVFDDTALTEAALRAALAELGFPPVDS